MSDVTVDVLNKRNEEICVAANAFPLAMAYVPWQKWEMPYEPEVGFRRGTIFPSLDLPFIGEEAVGRGK